MCSAKEPPPLKEEASPVRGFYIALRVLVSDYPKNAF
jgi:hypothetical protein